jgi:ketosteroid isomerase-like protein
MIKVKLAIIFVYVISVFFTNFSIAHETKPHSAPQPSLFMGIQSAPGQVVRQFHQALKAGDKITARKLLADEVLIFEGGGVERSADEYARHHMLSDMKYLAAMDSELLEHNVKVMANSAVSMSRSKTTGTYKDKALNYEGMETIVLEKQLGEWKIVRIHWSN